MKSEVFNSSMGHGYDFSYPTLTEKQKQQILAGLFEQLLIFDRVIINTNRLNFGLIFLISQLGIDAVEKLFGQGYIKMMLWSPVIVTSGGRQMEDGSVDDTHIYGMPPLAAGSLTDGDLDPEKNIHIALANFGFHRDRRRIFTRTVAKGYIVPNGMEFSTGAADLVVSAYQNNNLGNLGLPYEKEPDQLNLEERKRLLDLGYKVMETAILSRYGLKSYEDYARFEICKQNIVNIGRAYNVAENSGVVFNLEGLPDLKTLYLQEKMNFESVFSLRHLTNAKYYRKWINEVGENSNAAEITKEYLNEIKGNNSFYESTNGKLIKNLASFGIGTALGMAVAGPIGAAVGLGFGLLETYWLDGLLKGRNPSMFIENVKVDIEQ